MTTSEPRITRAQNLGAHLPMLVLLLLAGLAVEEGIRLIAFVDPAAQADMAGWYVLVLGLVLAVTAAYGERPRRTDPPPPESTADGDAASAEHPARPQHPYRDMTVCVALVVAYAALLDPLGYAATGILVVFGFLRFVSRYGWIKSLGYTAIINAALITLFELAGVVLPAGILRF